VGFDALLKKYFLAVVLCMVAMAAYFQAAGATALLGGAFLPSVEQLSVLPKAPPPPQREAPTPKSAERILSRNIFDSTTGPINPNPQVESPEEAPKLDTSNALGAPPCDGIRAAIITESSDPAWSIAALQGPGDARPTPRRVGDSIGSAQIVYIGFNSYQGTPSVWLVDGPKLCQAALFAQQQGAPPSGAPPANTGGPQPPSTPPPTPPVAGGAPSLPADMASKIQKVSATEFNVDRSVVDRILEKQTDLMRSARIVPEQQDGKVVGVRLFGIRPDTLLGHLGFQNGDRLETLNGFSMSSPDKALEAYARLRTASELKVKITRRGQPVNIDINIK
jgi:general secretion pathway protein C